MHHDPRVMATLGGLRSDDQTQQCLHENLTHWDRYGYGLWMFRAPADNRFAGRSGLRHIRVVGNAEVELTYALMAAFWGRGLATEMEGHLDSRIRASWYGGHCGITLTTNQASQRVMEKVGCTFEREIDHAGLPHVLYRIRREEYVTA